MHLGSKSLRIFDAGRRCGAWNKWVISAETTPGRRYDVCTEIPFAQVGCVGAAIQANGTVKLAQVDGRVCSTVWNNQAGFNSPQAQEAYKIILQILGAVLESL